MRAQKVNVNAKTSNSACHQCARACKKEIVLKAICVPTGALSGLGKWLSSVKKWHSYKSRLRGRALRTGCEQLFSQVYLFLNNKNSFRTRHLTFVELNILFQTIVNNYLHLQTLIALFCSWDSIEVVSWYAYRIYIGR